jgi:hypothetical protein
MCKGVNADRGGLKVKWPVHCMKPARLCKNIEVSPAKVRPAATTCWRPENKLHPVSLPPILSASSRYHGHDYSNSAAKRGFSKMTKLKTEYNP